MNARSTMPLYRIWFSKCWPEKTISTRFLGLLHNTENVSSSLDSTYVYVLLVDDYQQSWRTIQPTLLLCFMIYDMIWYFQISLHALDSRRCINVFDARRWQLAAARLSEINILVRRSTHCMYIHTHWVSVISPEYYISAVSFYPLETLRQRRGVIELLCLNPAGTHVISNVIQWNGQKGLTL